MAVYRIFQWAVAFSIGSVLLSSIEARPEPQDQPPSIAIDPTPRPGTTVSVVGPYTSYDEIPKNIVNKFSDEQRNNLKESFRTHPGVRIRLRITETYREKAKRIEEENNARNNGQTVVSVVGPYYRYGEIPQYILIKLTAEQRESLKETFRTHPGAALSLRITETLNERAARLKAELDQKSAQGPFASYEEIPQYVLVRLTAAQKENYREFFKSHPGALITIPTSAYTGEIGGDGRSSYYGPYSRFEEIPSYILRKLTSEQIEAAREAFRTHPGIRIRFKLTNPSTQPKDDGEYTTLGPFSSYSVIPRYILDQLTDEQKISIWRQFSAQPGIQIIIRIRKAQSPPVGIITNEPEQPDDGETTVEGPYSRYSDIPQNVLDRIPDDQKENIKRQFRTRPGIQIRIRLPKRNTSSVEIISKKPPTAEVDPVPIEPEHGGPEPIVVDPVPKKPPTGGIKPIVVDPEPKKPPTDGPKPIVVDPVVPKKPPTGGPTPIEVDPVPIEPVHGGPETSGPTPIVVDPVPKIPTTGGIKPIVVDPAPKKPPTGGPEPIVPKKPPTGGPTPIVVDPVPKKPPTVVEPAPIEPETIEPDTTEKIPTGRVNLGCFRDQPQRILPNYFKKLENNSPARCIALCLQYGYQYAGVEYGTECYCGKEMPPQDSQIDGTNCNMNCPNRPFEKCGGDWSINVYKTRSIPPPPPSNTLGCFRDTPQRILPDYYVELEDNSPTRCIALCRQNGYQYAGVEYGNECLCGKERPPQNSQIDDTNCNMNCPNRPFEKCGGRWSINVYKTGIPPPPPPPPSNTLGCYRDQPLHRILPNYFKELEDNSPARCIALCMQYGYQYAGVEYGTECFCGKEMPPQNSQIDDDNCNMKCPKSPYEICGGDRSINVYKTGIPAPPPPRPSLGCYRDQAQRILPDYFKALDDNSPSRCIALCVQNGYQYAGVEFGVECYCGRMRPPQYSKIDDKYCNMECPKSPFEKCGGPWSIKIYNTWWRSGPEPIEETPIKTPTVVNPVPVGTSPVVNPVPGKPITVSVGPEPSGTAPNKPITVSVEPAPTGTVGTGPVGPGPKPGPIIVKPAPVKPITGGPVTNQPKQPEDGKTIIVGPFSKYSDIPQNILDGLTNEQKEKIKDQFRHHPDVDVKLRIPRQYPPHGGLYPTGETVIVGPYPKYSDIPDYIIDLLTPEQKRDIIEHFRNNPGLSVEFRIPKNKILSDGSTPTDGHSVIAGPYNSFGDIPQYILDLLTPEQKQQIMMTFRTHPGQQIEFRLPKTGPTPSGPTTPSYGKTITVGPFSKYSEIPDYVINLLTPEQKRSLIEYFRTHPGSRVELRIPSDQAPPGGFPKTTTVGPYYRFSEIPQYVLDRLTPEEIEGIKEQFRQNPGVGIELRIHTNGPDRNPAPTPTHNGQTVIVGPYYRYSDIPQNVLAQLSNEQKQYVMEYFRTHPGDGIKLRIQHIRSPANNQPQKTIIVGPYYKFRDIPQNVLDQLTPEQIEEIKETFRTHPGYGIEIRLKTDGAVTYPHSTSGYKILGPYYSYDEIPEEIVNLLTSEQKRTIMEQFRNNPGVGIEIRIRRSDGDGDDKGAKKVANQVIGDIILHLLQLVNQRGAQPLKILMNGAGGFVEDVVKDGHGPGLEVDIERIIRGIIATRNDPDAEKKFLEGFDHLKGEAGRDVYRTIKSIVNDAYNAAQEDTEGEDFDGPEDDDNDAAAEEVIMKGLNFKGIDDARNGDGTINPKKTAARIIADIIGHLLQIAKDLGDDPIKKMFLGIGGYVEDKMYNGGPGLEEDYRLINKGVKGTRNNPNAVPAFMKGFTNAQGELPEEIEDVAEDIVQHVADDAREQDIPEE